MKIVLFVYLYAVEQITAMIAQVQRVIFHV